MQRFYDDDGMNFAVLISLGFAYANITDVGETLATIERIPEGDIEAWVTEWTKTADRLVEQADASLAGGHAVSARTKLLRASTYYDHASAQSPGTKDPSRYTTLWELHRKCWDRAVEIFETPVEHVQIPYEGTTLEGYLFTPNGDTTTPRPTVVLNNGSDGPVISQWSMGGRAAIARGFNALTFDGPGEGASLHRQQLYFRADWEQVVTPVVDWLVTRPEVDPGEDRARRASARAGTGRHAPPRSSTGSRRWSPTLASCGWRRRGSSTCPTGSCSSSTTATRRTSTRSWTPTRTSSRRRCSPGAWRPTAPRPTTRRT